MDGYTSQYDYQPNATEDPSSKINRAYEVSSQTSGAEINKLISVIYPRFDLEANINTHVQEQEHFYNQHFRQNMQG